MVDTGTTYMMTAWWYAIFPGLAIMVTVMGFNFIGDGLRDALDPTLYE
jgi:peptide/nickel transport system permease protein